MTFKVCGCSAIFKPDNTHKYIITFVCVCAVVCDHIFVCVMYVCMCVLT